MAKKEFTYRGKTIEEMQKMSLKEFSELLPSQQRRKIKRGMNDAEKKLLEDVTNNKKNLKTHCRDMIILPIMVGKTMKIHRGNSFETIIIDKEMIGHRIGEFALSRKRVAHSAPGIGATRSSASMSVR